jgi:hypothetical protein
VFLQWFLLLLGAFDMTCFCLSTRSVRFISLFLHVSFLLKRDVCFRLLQQLPTRHRSSTRRCNDT